MPILTEYKQCLICSYKKREKAQGVKYWCSAWYSHACMTYSVDTWPVLCVLPCPGLKWWPDVPSHWCELCIWQFSLSPHEVEGLRCWTFSPSPADMKTVWRRAEPHSPLSASPALRGSPRRPRWRLETGTPASTAPLRPPAEPRRLPPTGRTPPPHRWGRRPRTRSSSGCSPDTHTAHWQWLPGRRKGASCHWVQVMAAQRLQFVYNLTCL